MGTNACSWRLWCPGPSPCRPNLGAIIRQGSSPGLDSVERLTSVNINVTDGSLPPLLWPRGWQPSLSPGPLKSQIYYGGIWTGKQLPWSAVLTSKSRVWNLWFSVNTKVATLSSLHLWITVGTELQNWASPRNELCSTKSGSAKPQKKISFIHLLVSHSRPTYWISIRISFVLFWKLLNHSKHKSCLPIH